MSVNPISTKLYGKYGNPGEIQAITFSGDLPYFKKKIYGTMTTSHLSYIAIIHKAVLFLSTLSGKGQIERQDS